jgi:hypothetical protein
MKNIWTNFEGEEDDDDDFGLSKDHDDAWTVKINGVNESYWKSGCCGEQAYTLSFIASRSLPSFIKT